MGKPDRHFLVCRHAAGAATAVDRERWLADLLETHRRLDEEKDRRTYLAAARQSSDNADGKGGQGKSAAALKPGEIEVTVLNGTAVPGLAATYGDKVERKGFQLGAVTNSARSFSESVVMFKRGHAPEARRVASVLGISDVRLMSSDIASVSAAAPVVVIVGEDNAQTSG